MAMSSITGGGTAPTRPAANVLAVYENFKPETERIEDEESNSLRLNISLPGYLKEQLRVSIEGMNTLRIRGKRLVAGNKWIKFQEDYPLPEDCNPRGIRARFQEGILAVIIPRMKEAEGASKPAQKIQEKASDGLRQLLVNLSAVVLLIVAFGAYLSYSNQGKLRDV